MNPPPIEERTWWRAAVRRVQRRSPRASSGGRPLGVGLIGVGNVARWQHLPSLQRHAGLFRLVAVCDVDMARAREVAARTGATAGADASAVAHHAGVEAILVCTPTPCHAEGILAALDARKPVLSEKPLAATFEEACLLAERARAAGIPTAVNFSYRFRNDFALVRDLIRGGTIGDVLQVWGSVSQGQWFDETGAPSRERPDAAPWKFAAGGGVVLDLGPHLLDLMRWWCGEIDRVQAWTASAPRAPDCDAACGIALRFASGACAQLLTSRFATGSKEQGFLEINGTKGAVRFADGAVSLWTRAQPRWQRLMLPASPPPDLLMSFHAAIHGRATAAPDFGDGCRNNELLAAVMTSARTGKAVFLPLVLDGVTPVAKADAAQPSPSPRELLEDVLVRS